MKKALIDKLVLFALCTFCLGLTGITLPLVSVWLIGICVSALNSYFPPPKSAWLCGVFCLLCLFWKDLLLFLPLVTYDCAALPKRYQRLMGVVPLLYGIFFYRAVFSAGVCLLCTLAFLLQNRSSQFEKMQTDYYHAHDAIQEKTLRLEQKNQELMEKQDYEVRLATLSERNRIAREIHDNVGHLLTRSLLQVGAMQVVYKEEESLKEQLDCVKDTLADAMESIRSSVHDLHEDAMDLETQLNTLIANFSFCPVTMNYHADSLPKEIKYCFISIIREGLSNIAKHSNATQAAISVLDHPAFYQLTLEDNGTAAVQPDPHGMGLQNMRDRVESLHGIFRIQRRSGFQLFISIPKGESFF